MTLCLIFLLLKLIDLEWSEQSEANEHSAAGCSKRNLNERQDE